MDLAVIAGILYRILGFVLYLLIGQDFHKSRMFKAKRLKER